MKNQSSTASGAQLPACKPPFLEIAIDRGGTFTDVYARYGKQEQVFKLLSEDPDNYADAPSEGVRRALERFGLAADALASISSIRMGTTVATNALLERKGQRCGLLTTAGLEDVLSIATQARPDIFALDIQKTPPLFSDVLPVNERVLVVDQAGELSYRVEQAAQHQQIRQQLQKLLDQGISSVAVLLMHAHAMPQHELMIGEIAREMGFNQISLSHQVLPVRKLLERGNTTVMDAYLTPVTRVYLQGFGQSLGDLQAPLWMMQSDGGLCPPQDFGGAGAVLSGPAGGVVGYASLYQAQPEPDRKPLIGFDMGGTSTDVSRYAGHFDISFDNEIAGIATAAPRLEIKTVAAGGGSRLFYRNGLLQTGPESAGAHPGPVCYRKNGYLAVTDANLILGRIQPQFFPAIFGEQENQPLDVNASRAAFENLLDQVNRDQRQKGLPEKTIEQLANDFLDIANENMAAPVREVSVAQGYDVSQHLLAAFGGAGPQHALAVARKLGIEQVVVHRHGGVLSAVGMSFAAVSRRYLTPLGLVLDAQHVSAVQQAFSQMARNAVAEMQQIQAEIDRFEYALSIRLQGSVTTLEVVGDAGWTLEQWQQAFVEIHQQRFGYVDQSRLLEVEEARLLAVSGGEPVSAVEIAEGDHQPKAMVDSWFDGQWYQTPVYDLDNLKLNQTIDAPALVMIGTATVVIEPSCQACKKPDGHLWINLDLTKNNQVEKSGRKSAEIILDSAQLSIFHHRFSSIATQMGEMLRRTSVSVNIRERLDFSCALFDGDGNLVANAPHVPVHLGAMSSCVKAVIEQLADQLQPDDCVLVNDPCFGGSHLPDLTTVTPVFIDGKIAFFTASRGHHADIGGIVPGSMPAFSKNIEQEGALFQPMRIIKQGVFDEALFVSILQKHGARKIAENISDLQAQAAADRKGVQLIQQLMQEQGSEKVLAAMRQIQQISQHAVEQLLTPWLGQMLTAEDQLDDGSKIVVSIEVFKNSQQQIRARFDFSQSSDQQSGNQNTPIAVTRSAVVYVLRMLCQQNLPLNEGFLAPLELIFKQQSILSPGPGAAVAGGNVTTSQRVVDVLLQAFNAVADSCGCMNNLAFGNEHFGYYETLGGGSGASENQPGASGVHTHMTNTRLADPEVLERRCPVILRQFGYRAYSGGKGLHPGGDGLTRLLEFTQPVHISLMTERRSQSPKGLAGGGNGKAGENYKISQGKSQLLTGRCSVDLQADDQLQINTPGGGGWGE